MYQLQPHMDEMNKILEKGEGLAMGSISRLAHRLITELRKFLHKRHKEVRRSAESNCVKGNRMGLMTYMPSSKTML